MFVYLISVADPRGVEAAAPPIGMAKFFFLGRVYISDHSKERGLRHGSYRPSGRHTQRR
jgi:hypothetical protein